MPRWETSGVVRGRGLRSGGVRPLLQGGCCGEERDWLVEDKVCQLQAERGVGAGDAAGGECAKVGEHTRPPVPLWSSQDELEQQQGPEGGGGRREDAHATAEEYAGVVKGVGDAGDARGHRERVEDQATRDPVHGCGSTARRSDSVRRSSDSVRRSDSAASSCRAALAWVEIGGDSYPVTLHDFLSFPGFLFSFLWL